MPEIVRRPEGLPSPFSDNHPVNSYLVVVRKFFAYLERLSFYPNIAKDIKGCARAPFFMKNPLTI